MAFLHEILDFIARVAWPAVAVFAIIIVKDHVQGLVKSILELLPRMKKGPVGTEFEVPTQQGIVANDPLHDVESTKQSSASVPKQTDQLPKLVEDTKDSPTIHIGNALSSVGPLPEPWAEKMRQDLVTIGKAEKEQPTLAAVVTAIFNYIVQLAHERTYRVIFGTQISLLRLIYTAGSINREQAEQLFQSHKALLPTGTEPTFDKWISFLLQQDLVIVKDKNFAITVRGISFLNFLHSERIPENKSF